MMDCVQSPQKTGGTVWEIGKDQIRRVEVLHDPGPSGAGHIARNVHVGYADIFNRLEEKEWGK